METVRQRNQYVACRPKAFEFVRQQLERLDTTAGLVHAVLGVSMHALDDARPEVLDAQLDTLAARVLAQCRMATPTALVTHLHDVLFEQDRFAGPPQERYYNPLNSYLPAVLGLRHGLPITLGLVYKAVAERVGLEVEGISSRGHFLIRVHDGRGWLIVDPFHGGRVLTIPQACDFVSQIVGEPLQPSDAHLPTATHKQWLLRVIVNLAQIFEAMRKPHDLQAMHELAALVLR